LSISHAFRLTAVLIYRFHSVACIIQIDAVVSVRIDVDKRIVASIGVKVPTLRVRYVSSPRAGGIGAHEAAHAGCVVSGPEVVVAGFGITFFAGEVSWVCSDGAERISKR